MGVVINNRLIAGDKFAVKGINAANAYFLVDVDVELVRRGVADVWFADEGLRYNKNGLGDFRNI